MTIAYPDDRSYLEHEKIVLDGHQARAGQIDIDCQALDGMTKVNTGMTAEQSFWGQMFSANPQTIVTADKLDKAALRPEKPGEGGDFGLKRLFQGEGFYGNPSDKMIILKNGVDVHEVPIEHLHQETVIGRHPEAHIQLEAYKLGLFHIVLRKKDDKLYVEAIDEDYGTLLNRKRIKVGQPVLLRDGSLVDIPGYRLRFHLASAPPTGEEETTDAEELAEIPSYFYNPPPPPASPLLTNLVEDREKIGIWSEGVTTVKVADIVEETHDVKTFRLVGEKPVLFSYRPGQFATFLLNIDGEDVERSYSMSSSPSRPHVLEMTVKRVPGGIVSNWLCDRVKLGQRLTIKGPAGKFSCFNYPATKMLFIGAGSGITPLMAMSRWIVDTTSDVDVKLLASFKSPSEIIFRKELELISARHSRFQVAVTLTSGWHGTEFWTGFRGRVNKSMIRMLAPDLDQRHVFLCGPEPFMAEAQNALRELGFDLAKLHSESFGRGRVARGVKGGVKSLTLSEPRHKVCFSKTGLTADTDENVTLLELAEAHGIEIDYACRIGNCGECEVKFAGKVCEKGEFELAGKCKENGLAYACCSVALSDLDIQA